MVQDQRELLHEVLGGARPVAVAGGCALLLGLGVALGRYFARELDPWLAGLSARRRLVSIAVAVAIAGGAHAGLYAAERALTRDQTYAAVMSHRDQRVVARELEREVATRANPPSEAELRALRAQLERRHRQFPLRSVLACALAVALGVGVALGVRGSAASGATASAPSRLTLSPLALACGLSLLAVLVLRSPWWR